MVTPANVGTAFNSIVQQFGTSVRFRYFNESPDTTGYDSDVKLYQSGADLWVNAVVQTLNNKSSSSDAILFEQGKILINDNKMYLNGSIVTNIPFRVGIGSPTMTEFGVVPIGTQAHVLNNQEPFKTVYIRALPTGSLVGE